MQDARFDDLCGYLETPLGDDGVATYGRELAYLRRLRAGEDQAVAVAAQSEFELLA